MATQLFTSGTQLKALRNEFALTVPQLAWILNLKPPTIEEYEAGRRKCKKSYTQVRDLVKKKLKSVPRTHPIKILGLSIREVRGILGFHSAEEMAKAIDCNVGLWQSIEMNRRSLMPTRRAKVEELLRARIRQLYSLL